MSIVLSLYSLGSRTVGALKNSFYERGWLKPQRAPLPVISVGNLGLGGTGKTPVAMEILDALLKNGRRPALISRGYKGAWENRGGVLSDGTSLLGGWKEGGDEPYLVALRLPGCGVLVGKNRISSCLRAAAMGFDAVVLDDGFQHRKLHRDLDILLHDPAQKIVWRESPASAERADIVLLPRDASESAAERIRRAAPRSRFFRMAAVPQGYLQWTEHGWLQGTLLPPEHFRGTPVLAFCGLASPSAFFKTLENLGLRLVKTAVFPDHHDYPIRSWKRLVELCRSVRHEAVVTTEKDAVKLLGRPGVPGPLALHVLRLRISLEDEFFDSVISSVSGIRRSLP